jgi:hypothetical protein
MNVSDKGLHPNKNLCVFLPTIDSRNIGLDGVCSYRFIMLSYIDHRIGRLKVFAKDSIEGHPCILGGDIESLLDIPSSMKFLAFGGESSLINQVVHRFVEREV